MPGFSHAALQQALYQTLHNDATLMGHITDVYDFVPAGASYPYITLGELSGKNRSTQTSQATEYVCTIRIFSGEGGRKQTALIMERIHTLLHMTSLSVTGYALVLLRMDASDILLQDDGLRFQGILRFRALTEAL